MHSSAARSSCQKNKILHVCNAEDINALGQVVGAAEIPGNDARAFLWEEGRGMINLGTLPDEPFSWAYAINNHTQIVGRSWQKPFIWEHGQMHPLFADGCASGYPRAINDRGQVVGESACMEGGGAFLCQGGFSVDLTESIVNNCGDVRLEDAVDINESGQIVARGVVDGFDRAYLLSPGRLACDDIRKMKASCSRGGTLKVKIKSALVGGTILPLTQGGGDGHAMVVSRKGKGKATWQAPTGEHDICLSPCAMCRAVECR
ncbi:MAG: hypothetical protein C4547_02175 [Phycisphaerales bacterium]|nr:MAG: hypothetical protein C4547_02175 [Phycisphaerales bacterium]